MNEMKIEIHNPIRHATDPKDLLGKVVQFRTGVGPGGPRGRITSYTDAPTYTFVDDDGRAGSWRADMAAWIVEPDLTRCKTCDEFTEWIAQMDADRGEWMPDFAAQTRVTLADHQRADKCPDGRYTIEVPIR